MIGYSKEMQLGKKIKKKKTVVKKTKKKVSSIKKGKKTKEWDRVRAILDKRFEAVGISLCELMIEGKHNQMFIAYAHEKKRRKLKPEEIARVAKACQGCHDHIEYGGTHQEMYEVVNEAIEKRPEHVNKILLASVEKKK